jgi:hypothetical protein
MSVARIETLPRFPATRGQREVAGRHYLTKAEINALYLCGLRPWLPSLAPKQKLAGKTTRFRIQNQIGYGSMSMFALRAMERITASAPLVSASGRFV